jgi:hypothetical protein
MANYSLQLLFKPDDLSIVRMAGLELTIAKPISSMINTFEGMDSSSFMTWLAFDPLQDNLLTWDDCYCIYASTTIPLEKGTVVYCLSQTSFPAQDAAYYSYGASAIFSGPYTGSGAAQPGSYKVINDMPYNLYPALTFGLQQKATVNSRNMPLAPINAAVVPSSYPIIFTPEQTIVYVWLQAGQAAGTVITTLPANGTKVAFGNGTTQQKLQYNPVTGKFVSTA